MIQILTILLQCGAFILILGVSFGLGLWLILRYKWHQHKLANLFFALLIGFLAFEASIIGMAIDPRSSALGWQRLFGTAGFIGIGTMVFVLVFTPVYVKLIKIFR